MPSQTPLKIFFSAFLRLFFIISVVAAEEKEPEEDSTNIAIIAVIIITTLVIISILFELLTEKLLEETDDMNKPFVNTIFSELTTLGFIGLLLFVVTKLNILSSISVEYLGEKEKLQETIELLHMTLFLFIIIFLILCCTLLRFGVKVQEEWRQFERRCMDITAVLDSYCIATEPKKSLCDKLNLWKILEEHKCHRELVYVALRRRFCDPRSNHPDPDHPLTRSIEFQVNPNIHFPFNEYLSIISGEVMGRLIDIDYITWIALEIFIVTFWLVCWKAGPNNERWILLGGGFFLILLNQYVYNLIYSMRVQLTPKKLFKKAERLREKKKWRQLRHLSIEKPSEKSSLQKPTITITENDSIPPYVQQLPNGGTDMDALELNKAQKSLLGGKGNGVLLALFSARMVFLLTAMHLSVFLVRDAFDIYSTYNWPTICLLYFLFILPSILVSFMSIRIARDGLYAFNVEHMKVPRIIVKVMRIIKARQTLRTLRFVAEMKVYLREDKKRDSVIIMNPEEFAKALQNSNRPSDIQTNLADGPSPLMSPISPKKKHKRNDDAYELELERREINSIFCLFDSDGSGAVSRDEMQGLLQSITHDMTNEQINRIMKELDHNEDGEIDFESFYKWCHSRIRQCNHSTEELIEEVFNMVDTDRSGEITVDEFIAIFKTLGQSLDHDDVRELVYQMDTNDDGKINLEEFSRMLRKHAV